MIVALKTLVVLAMLAAYAALFTPLLVATVRSLGEREIGYRDAFKVMIYTTAWQSIASHVFEWIVGEPDARWVSPLVRISAGVAAMTAFLIMNPKLPIGRATAVSSLVLGAMVVVGFVIGVVAVLTGVV